MIKLIINADDFGFRMLFNKMILELIETKVVTSTSVMVDKIDFGQKEQIKKLIQLSKKHLVGVGLHIYFRNTNFKNETNRQFEKFVEVFKFEPSHIDIHKKDYIENGYPIIQEFCREKKIPCKNLGLFGDNIVNNGDLITINNSTFSGTGKSFFQIKKWLSSLREGYYSINFHPGYYDPNFLESISNKEGKRELDAKNIKKTVNCLNEFNIELANYGDLKASYSM